MELFIVTTDLDNFQTGGVISLYHRKHSPTHRVSTCKERQAIIFPLGRINGRPNFCSLTFSPLRIRMVKTKVAINCSFSDSLSSSIRWCLILEPDP